LSPIRSTVIAMIGANSPSAPAPNANAPKGLSATPASSRIGINAPIDVVVRTSPINRSETCHPSWARIAPTTSAAPNEMNHDTVARVNGAPRTRRKSIS
jgi:hypothetical protein